MHKLRIACLWVLFLTVPLRIYSTHIVGGVLNYHYNGGNIYTITVKLYRDCGPSAAAFPNSITIDVRGNNGAKFTPSKNLTITISTITAIPAVIDPCGIPPNPMPCVQEGIYTKTISLPPNNGGYHLFYQIVARNLSLTNINGQCNCIGESFYAYIPNNTVSSNSNSNAVFNSFPPLFLCAGKGFTVNSSASDANGDSLAYSLYAPYNGDNGNGPLDPTFPNNIATFTPVNYLNGYSATSPLGTNSPFSINPVTGILTGTPNTVGQFVVGVKVKEYRNGVVISETIRDFQFNVLNCPQPPPSLAVADVTTNMGCAVQVHAQGINTVTATWSSIAPGLPGAYDHFLSCTSICVQPFIQSTGTPPPYVDFKVCGVSTNCLQQSICDTFRVYFNPPLTVSIAPSNPALCNGQTSTTISAIPGGGTPPYTFLWNNVNPSQVITVGAGTYNIKLTDASGCPPVYNSAVVTSYSVPVAINAGPDQHRCSTNPVAILNPTMTGASGLLWSGGTGTFSPNNTTASNLFYTPSASELAAGSTTLYVTTTGNGFCPSDSDTIVISYSPFSGTVVTTPTAVSCFGGTNGAAAVTINGGMAPHTYTWSMVPAQTTSLATGLTAGNYSVTVTNSIGCSAQRTVNITQPQPLAFTSTLSHVTCAGAANGSINTSVSGGNTPYTYSWAGLAQTTGSLAGLTAGSYTATVTDNKSCTVAAVMTVTQPATLVITGSQTNVACYGMNTGAITSSVSGGTAPYTYTWSPGFASTPSLNNIPAGVYTLTVKDLRNCTQTRTVNITQPASLSVTTTFTNESCDYLNNGAASAVAAGGAGPYNYLWTPGSFTSSALQNLSSGSYSVVVTDQNGCSTNTGITISEPLPLTVSFSNQKQVSCFGGNNGSLTAHPAGGTAAYSFTWMPGALTGSAIINQMAGSYTVNVLDSRSCTVSNTVEITEPLQLSQSATINSVSCFGGNDGSITPTVSGGTTPYNYFWLPGGQNSAGIATLSAGNYSLIVTDANSCTLSASYSVTQASSITAAFSATNVSCFAGNDAAVTATTAGGHAPYTYSWSTGGSSSSAVSLTAGTYTLHVTDNLNCQSSFTVNVTEPTQLTAGFTHTNESCDYLNNGVASGTASGGTPGYSYLWTPGSFTTQNISSLPAGNYSLSVTDQLGCIANTLVVITEPPTLTVTSIISGSVNCFGGSNGSAQAQVAGGTPGYLYLWSPGNSTLNSITGLIAGQYTVTVNDLNNCQTQATVDIVEPAPITIAENQSDVWCSGGANGEIVLTPSGGMGQYSYFWMPGGQTTSSLTALSAGTYTAYVTDINGCNAQKSFTISQSPPIVIVISSTAVSCFQGSDGILSASVTGGAGPYTYTWSQSGTTSSITSLQAGNYNLIVNDSLGCVQSQTATVTEPTALQVAVSFTNETCDYSNDGFTSALASGGTPGYTYTWQPGSAASHSLTLLASGTYTVFVEDQMGCTTQSAVIITEPAPLVLSFNNINNVKCFGGSDGSATALASGGTANYTYTWMPGGSTQATAGNLSAGLYTITTADSKGCVGADTLRINEPNEMNVDPVSSDVICNGASNGAISLSINGGVAPYLHMLMPGNVTGANFSNLQPGTYTIFTTDANNCATSETVSINEPVGLSTVISFTNATCGQFNGVATVSVSNGGIPPFTYTWMPSAVSGTINSNLGAGIYTVQVTDSTGCESIKFVNVNNLPAPAVSIISSTNVSCFGGSDGALTASYTPGNGPSTYTWLPAGGNALTATNLIAGFYSIKIQDSSGCISFATTSLITQPKALSTAIFKNDVSCKNGSDGTANAISSGGTGPYSYTWQAGVASGASVTGLPAGSYTVELQDNNNCALTSSFVISEPTQLLVSALSTSVSCYNGSDGTANATGNGGTAPYSYSWAPGNTQGQQAFGLSAGTYTAGITDYKGCTSSTTVEVTEPAQVVLAISSQNSDCSLANGQATVSAVGGSGTYSYTWMPSQANASVATALMAGSHSVSVNDSNNCNATASVIVSDNPAPQVSATSVTNVSCFNGADGAATASVTGGTGPFTYTWLPGAGTAATATGLSAGQYTVIVNSANGCTVAANSAVISQPTQLFVNVSTTSVNCFGGNTGAGIAQALGGTPAYNYSWSAGLTAGNSVTSLAAGIYTVTAYDALACSATKSFTITQPQFSLSLAAGSTSVSCAGGSNGSTSVTATGGTAPYNFNWQPVNTGGPSAFNLASGIYSVTGTDQNGCMAQTTVNVQDATPIILAMSSINSDCSFANGQASVNASGGAGSYSYQWSPSGGTAALATALMSGQYSVSVTDANNCNTSGTVSVSDLPAPALSVNTLSNVSCFGGLNGTAQVIVNGGTGPFTYSWSAGGSNTSTGTGLSAGLHTVTVVSANGCTVSASTPFVTQPAPIAININVIAVSCFNGSDGEASSSVFGGTGAYSYSWTPASSSLPAINGLTTGIYSLTVTDANSCVSTSSASVPQPSAPVGVVISSSSVSCHGGTNGTASVTISGGTAPYSQNWSPLGGTLPQANGLSAGHYTVNVYDNKGCNETSTVQITEPLQPVTASATVSDATCFGGSSGSATMVTTGGTAGYTYTWSPNVSSTFTAGALSAGNYMVGISDANNCYSVHSFSVGEPTLLTASVISTQPSCGFANGFINSQVEGGTGPYSYTWSPGAQTTASAFSLAPGSYTLLVNDAQGCDATVSTSLTDIPGPVVAAIGKQDVLCAGGNNGTSTISINSGSQPFNIIWLPFGGNAVNGQSLTAGSYTASVTDSLGCIASATITINEPPQLALTLDSLKNVSCFGGSDGFLSVQASGGTAAYTYSWSSGSLNRLNPQLSPGSQTVMVKDANNCVSYLSAGITEPAQLTSTISGVTNALCNSGTGGATVTVNGGTAPYTYTWNSTPPQNSNGLQNVGAGPYVVDIRDRNNCPQSASVTISEPTQVITTVPQPDTLCAGITTVLTASASGGAGDYYFSWAPDNVINQGSFSISVTSPVSYTVVAFDKNGCAGSDAVSVINVRDLNASNLKVLGHTPICPGQASVLEAQTAGSTGSLTYVWSHQLPATPGLHIVRPEKTTVYKLTVSNSCGKTVTDSVNVTISDPPQVIISADSLSACAPGEIQFNDISNTQVNAADPIVSWDWNFGTGQSGAEQSPIAQFATAGLYTVNLTVITDRGCVGTASTPVVVEIYPKPTSSFTLNNTTLQLPYDVLKCKNLSTGAVNYEWSFGNETTSTLKDPQVRLNTIGETLIQLIAISERGCRDTSDMVIKTSADLVFPNAFTPNPNFSSGGQYDVTSLNNDVFFPYTSGVLEYDLQIFNRWGELIFESKDVHTGWDGYYRGKLSQQGVYVWKAHVKLGDGRVFNQSGNLTLIR